MRGPKRDREGVGHRQRQRFRQRTRIHATAARQHAFFGKKRDQTVPRELRAQRDLVLHRMHVHTQRAAVEPVCDGFDRGAQTPCQQVGGSATEDAPPRRRQPRAQTQPRAAVRVHNDTGSVQHLLTGTRDLQQPALAAACPARRPGQCGTERPLQKVGRRAACFPAAARPLRQPQSGAGYVDAQSTRRSEWIALYMVYLQGAATQRIAAPTEVPVVAVRPAVDPDQIPLKGIGHCTQTSGPHRAGSARRDDPIIPLRIEPADVPTLLRAEPPCPPWRRAAAAPSDTILT